MKLTMDQIEEPYRNKSAADLRVGNQVRLILKIVEGVDEAGRGPLAGPVVSAAVILPRRRFPRLADSKQLSPARRADVYRLIQRYALAVGVGIVDHQDVDRMNILQATYESMRRALAQL